MDRGQVSVGGVVLEPEPFRWPRSFFEVLELRFTRETGWKSLNAANAAALEAQFNGAHGTAAAGLAGIVVQYVEGTGGPAVAVADWLARSGGFAYLPDTGLDIAEIPGTAEDPAGPYYEGTVRLARIT